MPTPDQLKSYTAKPIGISPNLHVAGFGGKISTNRLPEVVRRLANTRTMSRLLFINQIGHEPIHRLGPTEHNRFKHSLSAAAVTQFLLENPKSTHSLLKFSRLTFIIAALLHDVGHYATSHSAEKAIPGLDHKNRLRRVLDADGELLDILIEFGIDLEEVIEVITQPFFGNIFNLGEVEFLSADHLSNEFGDTFHEGLGLSPMELNRLVPLLHINDQGKLALPKEPALMQKMIHVALAHHRTVFGIRNATYDTLGETATRMLYEEGIITLSDLEGDDRDVRRAFKHPDAPEIVKEMVYALDITLPFLRHWPIKLAQKVDAMGGGMGNVIYRDGGKPYVLRPTYGDEQEGELACSPLRDSIVHLQGIRERGGNIVQVNLGEILALSWAHRRSKK